MAWIIKNSFMCPVKALDKKGENIMTKLYKVVGMYELEELLHLLVVQHMIKQKGFKNSRTKQGLRIW